MRLSSDVKKYILSVSGISAVLTAIMLAVFALAGRFSMPVLWGALCGLILVCLNFILLAFTLNKAVDSQSGGKAVAGVSYTARMLMLLLGGIFAIVYLKVNPVALIIPYIFPRVSIVVMQIFEARRNRQGGDFHGR